MITTLKTLAGQRFQGFFYSHSMITALIGILSVGERPKVKIGKVNGSPTGTLWGILLRSTTPITLVYFSG